MSDNDQTKKFYNDNALEWSTQHNTASYWEVPMDILFTLVPFGKRVIEIGCGGGRDAKILMDHFDYTGIDFSEGLLDVAKGNNSAGSFLLMDLFQMNFEQKFDAAWLAAVLLHIPKDKIDLALQKIKVQLKKGAIGFISIKEGRGEIFEESERGTRFFAYYTQDEFTEILHRNGFVVIWFEKKLDPGRPAWLQFIVKKISES